LSVSNVTAVYPFSFSFKCRNLNGFAGAIARRRLSIDKPVATEVRTKPGALQTIFKLPPDEVHRTDHIKHSTLYYSCHAKLSTIKYDFSRLWRTAIPVLWRGHFYIKAACMSLRQIFASTQMYFQSN
jgi:hypothetical protein